MPEGHAGDVNTLRLCFREMEGPIIDYQMNRSDLYWLKEIIDILLVGRREERGQR